MPIEQYEPIAEMQKGGSASRAELGKLDSAEYEEFDKVRRAKGFRIYRDMQYDDMIKFGLIAKKLLLLGSGYDITPFDESSQSAEQAEFVKLAFQSMDRPLEEAIYDILSAIEYGFAVAEKLWMRYEGFRKELNGKIVLKDLKNKFPWDIEFVYDEYGNVKELKIVGETVDMKKFVVYSYLSQFGDKSGMSDLKSAYNGMWFRSNSWKFWARHLERFGSPIVKGHVPPGASREESDRFFVAINRMQHITGIMVPRGQEGHGQEFDFELVESKREGGSQFRDAIGTGDSMILRSFLFPRLWGATAESFGSYAVGQAQIQLALFLFTFICETFSESVINRQVIRPMIDMNYPNPLYPKYRLRPPTESIVGAMLAEVGAVRGGGSESDKIKEDENAGREEG